MKIDLKNHNHFAKRHIGPNDSQIEKMLSTIGVNTIDELVQKTIPKGILSNKSLNLPKNQKESDFLKHFQKISQKNKIFKTFIGEGYYDCITPTVIQRNILENPGWYTAYTPYQAEVAQGRLEALINFQTMVIDLTGMEIANASLLDEGTAAAEAMNMLSTQPKGDRKDAKKFLVDSRTFTQTIAVLETRAKSLGIHLEVCDINESSITDKEVFGILLQYPNRDGAIIDYTDIIQKANDEGVGVVIAADLLSLTLLKPPGELGADVVVGTTQRFGIPLGYGGPHAAYFATKEKYKRLIPGRIIGVSVDKQGNQAYRMALQTREQHIRREKATSNICTAQVLLAVMAGMYAVYHGASGLKNIALQIHGLAITLEKGLTALGYQQLNPSFFDTLKIKAFESIKDKIKQIALSKKVNLNYFENDAIKISLDETTSLEDINTLLEIFSSAKDTTVFPTAEELSANIETKINIRKTSYLTHDIFKKNQTEHDMLRYLKQLENKDLSLTHSMIALGSCTMKLNATTEMLPLSWPEINKLHPFIPLNQAEGYTIICTNLAQWLAEITGFSAVSLQPNSGAQGEYAGLMVIKAYHESKGDIHRNITLIPSSAHGTNPASAIMAGMQVVVVKCDERGNIDVNDLSEKAVKHKENLAALMITYPSTHGVFEERIKDICKIVHDNGGQVYMDGANMNAQVGLTSPAIIGADVCHLNLHKTFCIPHGGGGPGVGPIGVAQHLTPFLPGHPVIETGGSKAIGPIAAAPWGSASILTISYAYIALMGAQGLKKATEIAILSANYIKKRLEQHFDILYTGTEGMCAHEMIIDCRPFKKFGVEVEDIAKRLMDYGFHAPTVSFPVPGTMMIEPTESESLDELDRFCDSLVAIRKEIQEIEAGVADAKNNVLKNAPHTASTIILNNWDYPYTREKAVYPLDFLKTNKFWPSVSRIDSAYGDRNLFCSCIPTEAYNSEETLVS